jgi:hypothetical protein
MVANLVVQFASGRYKHARGSQPVHISKLCER